MIFSFFIELLLRSHSKRAWDGWSVVKRDGGSGGTCFANVKGTAFEFYVRDDLGVNTRGVRLRAYESVSVLWHFLQRDLWFAP